MDGRRIYHARGKVLGGSSSINGQIFQRGNPLDYERWAADPGMATWDYAHCLPYFKRMETCLAAAADDPFRGHDGPLVLERGPATNPLFTAFFEATQQAGYTYTPDVNGYRQEGFGPFDRNIHRGRRLSAARAYLHPIMGKRRNLTVKTRAFVTRILFEGSSGRRRRVHDPRRRRPSGDGRRGHPLGRRHQHAAAPAAVGRRAGPRISEALGIPVAPRPAGRRRSPAGPPGGLHPVRLHAARLACSRPRPRSGDGRSSGRSGCSCAAGPAPSNHFEGGGFARSNEDVAYPNLMFHFLPLAIRYDGSAGAAGHGYQVHVGPMYSDARGSVRITSQDPTRPSGPAVQLPLDRPGPAGMGGGGPGRPDDPGPGARWTRTTAARRRRARRVSTDDEVLDWVRRDAETALHPSCTARMGVDDASVVDPLTMRVHGAGRPARGGRVGDAVRHQRQHLRAGDDARREGRRPHPRARRRSPPSRSRSTGTCRPTGPGRARRPSDGSSTVAGGSGSDGRPAAPPPRSMASACSRSLMTAIRLRQTAATMPEDRHGEEHAHDARQLHAGRDADQHDGRMEADRLAVDDRGDEAALDDVEHDRPDAHDDDVLGRTHLDRDQEGHAASRSRRRCTG